MDSKNHLISIILIINFVITSTNARWTDKFDSYDTANLRNDYLSRYCLASGQSILNDRQELEHFLNCTQPGLLFTNISTSLTSEEFYTRNRTAFEGWCSTWKIQRACEEINQKYVDKCFTENPSISVGFDLLTAFFESACEKNGETFPDLILFLHMVREWCWYDERQVLSCFHQTNLHYFKRNIKLILPCLQTQLGYCGNNRNQSKEVLNNVFKEIETGYSSSRYVYLINVNVSQISNETFPLLPNYKCPNASFAYIAFFILLAFVLITLGALVFVKVRSLNLPCLQKRSALVENDGNTVEL